MNIYTVKVVISPTYWQLFVVRANSEKEAIETVNCRTTFKHCEFKATKMDFDSSWRSSPAVMIMQETPEGGIELHV